MFTCHNLKKDGFARVLRGCLLKLSTGSDCFQGLVNAHRVWPRSVWTLSLQAVLLWLSKPNLVGESCWNQETGNWNAWMCAHAHERKYGTGKHTNTHTHTHGLTISWLFAFDIWATGYLCFFVGRSSNILSPFTSPNVVRTNSCLWGQKKCKPFTMWPFWRNTRMPCWHPSYLLVNEVYDQTELSWGQWWALNWFD